MGFFSDIADAVGDAADSVGDAIGDYYDFWGEIGSAIKEDGLGGLDGPAGVLLALAAAAVCGDADSARGDGAETQDQGGAGDA